MFLMNSSAGGGSAVKRSVLYDRVNTFLWNDNMLLSDKGNSGFLLFTWYERKAV